ncbi:MAG TPA: ribosome maturation factor RimP, partial [Solirubrobacterales bacterium]|nr:ribosome maturation factor RimP [Solirubrobacterales bacterium]
MEELRADIEERIAALDPQIELIALDKAGRETLRLYIDHPDGVDLGRCEQVTKALLDLSAEWALEVSSPGLDRPLTKPDHYRRFIGSRVRVRTREAVEGRKNFTGRLEAADERCVNVADEQGLHEIPLDAVHRSNLVPEL